MADSLLIWLDAAGSLLVSAVLLYGAYWALSIRHAIFVRAYRNQALWLGFFSVYIIPHAINIDSFVVSLNSPAAYFANELYYIFLAVMLFRLIDVDIGLGRRSDPYLRDTLHWRKLRLVVWGIMTFSISSLVFLGIADTVGHSTSTSIVVPIQASVYLPFLVSGISAMLLVARRSKDETLRRSLKWFGLFFLVLLGSTMVYFLTSSGLVTVSQDILNAADGFIFVPAAYCLYRSARSLVPLGKLSPSGGD